MGQSVENSLTFEKAQGILGLAVEKSSDGNQLDIVGGEASLRAVFERLVNKLDKTEYVERRMVENWNYVRSGKFLRPASGTYGITIKKTEDADSLRMLVLNVNNKGDALTVEDMSKSVEESLIEVAEIV